MHPDATPTDMTDIRTNNGTSGFGFRGIETPLGATGHCGCDHWLIRDLDP
jgi:hypothetical protein